jgi:FtsH-binding integral membrane protein
MNPSFPRGFALARAASAARAASVNAYLPNFVALLCLWMAAGLTLTGFVTHLTVTLITASPTTEKTIRNLPILFALVLAAQFGFVSVVSALLPRLRTALAMLLFLLYAAGNGVWMAGVVILYVAISLDIALYATAGMFALLAGLVFLTKVDLLSPGALPVLALIGAVVATATNLFQQGMLSALLVNAVCVGVFVLLFAYDRERLRWLAIGMSGARDRVRRVGLLGAVMLYMDLLNIIFLLLRERGQGRQ